MTFANYFLIKECLLRLSLLLRIRLLESQLRSRKQVGVLIIHFVLYVSNILNMFFTYDLGDFLFTDDLEDFSFTDDLGELIFIHRWFGRFFIHR